MTRVSNCKGLLRAKFFDQMSYEPKTQVKEVDKKRGALEALGPNFHALVPVIDHENEMKSLELLYVYL